MSRQRHYLDPEPPDPVPPSRVKRKPSRRKKTEFSKILAVWAAVIATAIIAAPYVLSAFDKEPVGDLSGIVFTACIGYLITYAGKSLGEKLSRNKNRLDENGVPFEHEGNEGNDY